MASRSFEALPTALSPRQAYAVSAIAHWDWPENWPDLFDQLVLALDSGDANLVHGAMRVLTGECTGLCVLSLVSAWDLAFPHRLLSLSAEFCHDVSDQQMPHVAPIIFPQLHRILLQPLVSMPQCTQPVPHHT